MNFLAHLHLSQNNEHLMVGNFIGDFVKGNPEGKFSDPIVAGIIMHRRIDEFTDTHPVFLKSKDRIRKKYRHYSGIIIDIFYDHFLASNWNQFDTSSLEDFAENAYLVLRKHKMILPEKVKFMLRYMERDNWLLNYANLEGISKALSGMSRRARHFSKMEEAPKDLKIHYADLLMDFNRFYPELVNYSNEIKSGIT